MRVDFENTPTFIISKPESEKEKRCIRYMKSFGIDAVPIYGFRAHNCGISTDYYHNREKEKAKVKTIVAGLSHFSAWSAIKWMVEAKLTDHRTFLIVEDDVEFLDKNWRHWPTTTCNSSRSIGMSSTSEAAALIRLKIMDTSRPTFTGWFEACVPMHIL